MKSIHRHHTDGKTLIDIKALLVIGISALLCLLCSIAAQADDNAWVMSIPHAISGENIYKVRLDNIDGVLMNPAIKYRISSGRHVIRVSMLLNVEWDPELTDGAKTSHSKIFELDAKAGTIYQIGARFYPDAALESQLDGSYWEPILYPASPGF